MTKKSQALVAASSEPALAAIIKKLEAQRPILVELHAATEDAVAREKELRRTRPAAPKLTAVDLMYATPREKAEHEAAKERLDAWEAEQMAADANVRKLSEKVREVTAKLRGLERERDLLAATPDLSRVAALNAAVISHDAAIRHALGDLAATRARREPLLERLRVLERGDADAQVAALPPQDAITALAADPEANVDLSQMVSVMVDQRRQAHEREAERTVIAAAIDQIEAEIARAEADLSAMQETRAAIWADFSHAAHDYLIGQVRVRIQELKAEVLEPLLALKGQRVAGQPVISSAPVTLSNETMIVLTHHGRGEFARRDERLFPPSAISGDLRVDDPVAKIALFRVKLAGVPYDPKSLIDSGE